jgi:hypothetical protein
MVPLLLGVAVAVVVMVVRVMRVGVSDVPPW